MGYQTVQNLGKRYILPSGLLMSHRASVSGLSGEIGGELDRIMELLKDNVTELEKVAADRVGITLEKYRKDVSDELWLTAQKAVKTNHADEIVLVKCSEDLMETHIQTVRTFFGSFNVEFSDCPIITAPISVRNSNYKDIMKFTDYFNNITKRINFTL